MKTKVRIAGVLAAGAAALSLAACGSSSSGTTTKHAAASTTASTTSNASGVMVKTAKGSHGTYLVGPNGHAVYLFLADGMNKSNCSGACAKIWPPLTTTGQPSASGGAMSTDLGTITRSGGTKQVTYKGHPLYFYAADSGPGQTTGQGINGFGAKWWLVSPSGAAITKAASGSSSSGGSSTSSGGGWG